MARLLVLVDDAATRAALLQRLAAEHTVLTGVPCRADGAPGNAVMTDAVLVDARNLERRHEALQALRDSDAGAVVPVLLVAPQRTIGRLPPATWQAIDDVLATPVRPAELEARLRTVLELRLLAAGQARRLDSGTTLAAALEQRVRSRTRQMRKSLYELAVALAAATEAPGSGAAGHLRRIGYLAKTLAEALGMDPTFQDTIFHAGPLYDVGTVTVPRDLLARPGPLSRAEWRTVEAHPLAGEAILSAADSPYAAMGAQIAAAHHERWDGSGYPHRLSGSRIPLPARIVAVCDVYDSLRRARPYRAALDHTGAVGALTLGDRRSRPEQFDPAVLAAFGKAEARFRDVFETFASTPRAAGSGAGAPQRA